MIKVCHLASNHNSDDPRIFHKECFSLAKNNYEVHFVVMGENEYKNNVIIHGVKLEKNTRLWRMFCFSKKIFKRARDLKADIYHIHDPELLPYALKLKKENNIVIFDSHENMVGSIGEKKYIPSLIRPIIKAMYEKFQKYVCRRIDAVITATPNMNEYFQTFVGKVVDVRNYPILSEALLKREKKTNTVVYAGNFTNQWNILHAINALSQVPQMRLKLYGSGDKQIETFKKSKGWDQVDYYGRVPHEEIQDALETSSVGIALLSPGANTDWKNGNFANTKIFEEMMAGLPVICTKFKRWKSFVKRYKCGICVNPKNEEEIISAYRYIIDNPKEAEEMGANGRYAIEKEFNWKFEEKKLLALYEELSKKLLHKEN